MNLVLPFIPFLIYIYLDQYYPLDQEWNDELKYPSFSITNQSFIRVLTTFTILLFGYQLSITNSDWLLLATLLILYHLYIFRVEKNIPKSYWIMIAINLSLSAHLIKYSEAPDQLILIPSAIIFLHLLYVFYYLDQQHTTNKTTTNNKKNMKKSQLTI